MNTLQTFKPKIAGILVAFAAAASLAACGGGGSTASSLPPPATNPAGVTQSNIPIQQMVAGSYAWVDSSTHYTLYYLSNDKPDGGGCTGTCLLRWFPYAPNAYALQPSGGFTIVTRPDGRGRQFAYNGHPLYTYAGDTGPDQANGNNVPYNGGFWYIARPTTTPMPTPTPTFSPMPSPSPTSSPTPAPRTDI